MNDNGEADTIFAPEVLAYEAKELKWFLQHEGVQRALDSTERRIHKEWEAAREPLSREMCWHKLQAFKTLRDELRAMSQRKPLTSTDQE